MIGFHTMRTYKRKTERQSWNIENMQKAIEAVRGGNMGFKKAAATYGVPKSTLEDRIKKIRKGSSVEEAIRKGSFKYITIIFFI